MKNNEKAKRESFETKQIRAEVEENCPNAVRKENFDKLMQAVFGKGYAADKKTRILVAGPVTYINYNEFAESMDAVLKKYGVSSSAEIIIKEPVGFDKMVEKYANERGLCLTVMPVLREKYGRNAESIRREQALTYTAEAENPIVVAFCDGFALEPDLMLLAGVARGIAVEPFEVGIVRKPVLSAIRGTPDAAIA